MLGTRIAEFHLHADIAQRLHMQEMADMRSALGVALERDGTFELYRQLVLGMAEPIIDASSDSAYMFDDNPPEFIPLSMHSRVDIQVFTLVENLLKQQMDMDCLTMLADACELLGTTIGALFTDTHEALLPDKIWSLLDESNLG